MRKLGLDLGTKTCDIAVTDELCIIASGLENFQYTNNDFSQVLKRIEYYYDFYEKKIDEIILGFPTNATDGSLNARSYLILDFKSYLEKEMKLPLKVILYDERFTTRITKTYLKDQHHMKNSQIKKIKDEISAVVLLNEYIQYNRTF